MKIQKLSSAEMPKTMQQANFKGKEGVQQNNNSINSLMDSASAASLKSMINFKGKGEPLTDYEKTLITNDKNEIRVADLFNMPEDVHISANDMEPSSRDLNTVGLNIEKTTKGDKEIVKITNDNGNLIFEGEVKKGAKVPHLTYKQGKFMPEVTVKDDSLDGSVIKMFSGSKIKGEGFNFVMPGEYTNYENNTRKTVSFTGNVAITTLNKEPRTQNAVDLYMASDLAAKTTEGDYMDVVKENNPTIVIPAGGFGTRFHNLTRNDENKPSYLLPTANEYRIIATALNMAASAGVIDKDPSKNNLTYLSQMHEIEGENVKNVNKYKTDGGAIAEGLDEDYIDRHKDMIILNADIISNADISRAYNALKTLPNAALVIPSYAVGAERAKSFGLLGIEQDENGNSQLKSFVEKPRYTNKSPQPNEFSSDEDYRNAIDIYNDAQNAANPTGDGTFLANPGIYLLSPEATKVLRHLGIKDPSETGLGKSVMPEIVKLCNEGKLIGANGEPMKAYVVPLERQGGEAAFWDDIGTAGAYLKTIKNIAKETVVNGTGEDNKYYGMPEFVLNDFANNVDLDTSIVYMSEKARNNVENFKKEHGVSVIEGNMFAV